MSVKSQFPNDQYPIDLDKLKPYILHFIWRYNLKNKVSVEEVYSELIIRYHAASQRGRVKTPPQRWAKKASRLIVYEFSRGSQKAIPTDPSTLDVASADVPFDDLEWEEATAFLYDAIDSLDPDDVVLIKLRFFEDRSWKFISDYLLTHQGIAVSVSALRQRGCRAIRNLRKVYDEKIKEFVCH